MYIYPDNMKGKASLFLWRLGDMIAIVIGIILSVAMIVVFHFVQPLALVSAYAFLSIRFDDRSICDYIVYAFRFCVTTQQIYFWQSAQDGAPSVASFAIGVKVLK